MSRRADDLDHPRPKTSAAPASSTDQEARVLAARLQALCIDFCTKVLCLQADEEDHSPRRLLCCSQPERQVPGNRACARRSSPHSKAEWRHQSFQARSAGSGPVLHQVPVGSALVPFVASCWIQ